MQLSFQRLAQICRHHNFQLVIILLISFIFRLYRIDNPMLDWHAFRQADTASVTYRYTQEGIDLLHPRYHDLSNIQSGLENPQGYRMVEFPFINGLIAQILIAFPALDFAMTNRFIAILFSMGTLLSFYWLISSISSKKIALVSAAFLGFLPYSIYYSRVVLPEPFMLCFSTLSLALFVAYFKQKKSVFIWLSCLCLALALLLKPFVAFLAPVYFTIMLIYDPKFYKKLSIYLYPLLAFAPLVLWRIWINNFPEGVPASEWLLNGDGIRLRPAWFRWLFWERLTKMFAGITGLFFIAANLTKRDRLLIIIGSWWLGILGYFIVVATGNVKHDYYQVLSLPILAFTLGRGSFLWTNFLSRFLKNKTSFARILAVASTIVITVLLLTISWIQVKGFFNVNHWEYEKIGQEADRLLPKQAKVIAPAMGDTMFLFQTRRTGWPIGFNIDEKIKQGATHYVTNIFDDEATQLENKYITLKKTSEYIIIDLTNEKLP